MNQEVKLEVATLAGGCFWCIEGVFREVNGVDNLISGYTGGTTVNPTYDEVCTGKTGHAEAVQVSFNPSKISYREILEIFFSIHDPTTLNRQGADIGTQYRSAIFYSDDRQKAIAEQFIQELNKTKFWSDPIVTEVAPLRAFYVAEDYHQKYFEKNPEQAYCRMVITPKMTKFRKQYRSME
jgi:peptide-methionine (S)-S-oxide reductase